MDVAMQPKKSIHATRHRRIIATAALAALFGACSLDASAVIAVGPSFSTVARTTQLRSGDAVIGALPMTQPIHIEVALKMRDRAGLDAFIADNAKKQMAHSAPHLMTSDEFLANYAPTQAKAQAVAAYLTSMGFTHITIAPNRLLVSADGTAWTAGNAFKTRFAQVRTHDGRIAFANTDDVRIPAELDDKVLAVVGLQTAHQAHAVAPQASTDDAHTNAIQAHDPAEFASIYGAAGTDPASSVNVGIVADGDLNATLNDLDAYATNHGLAPVASAIVHTNGTSHAPGSSRPELASQVIVGMAGAVRKLLFYAVPTLSHADLTADYNAIVAANAVKIVAVPISECETDAVNDGSAAADDAIFAIAVAQGQTFAVAAGDSGADACPVLPHDSAVPIASWPAASQYVVAVGGTRLRATTTTWQGERMWSGTGGSPSTFEPMPSWQSAFGVPGTTRGTPDVAYAANPHTGALVLVNRAPTTVGGTNLSTALFAGSWARVLQARKGIGFAGPVLYALPATDFHDVVQGNNNLESAGPGYDFASGRGSMIVHRAIRDSAGLGNAPPHAQFHVSLSGSTVQFTDASTDSDGTIVSWSWKFGDGSKSTETHPSHTYAADGTYAVVETVSDNIGATRSIEHPVYVGPAQLLANPGFEAGSAAFWNVQGGGFVLDGVASVAYEGNYSALLTNRPDNDTVLSQRVTIPARQSSATLSFHLWVDDESAPDRAIDQLQVQVRSTSGQVLATLATFSNLDGTTGCCASYTLHSYDVRAYMGQTVDIAFVTPGESERLGTAFLVDGTGLFVH